jgi:mono/diheme cytochrome c family protein
MHATSPRAIFVFFVASVLLSVAAGCGGGSGSSAEEATTTETTTQTDTTSTTSQDQTMTIGNKVFTSNCSSCHTLAAAGASGSVGPNLDELEPSQGTVASKVKAGGGGMPSFKGQLTEAQISAVAEYVAANAGKSSSGSNGGTP